MSRPIGGQSSFYYSSSSSSHLAMAVVVPNVIPTTIEDWAASAELTNSYLLDDDLALQAALRNTEEKGLPFEIAVPAEQGKLLQLLATSIRAKRILEIGTLGG